MDIAAGLLAARKSWSPPSWQYSPALIELENGPAYEDPITGQGANLKIVQRAGVHGALLTEALSSRFSAQIRVSTDYDLAGALSIDPRAVRAAQNPAPGCTPRKSRADPARPMARSGGRPGCPS